MLPVQPFTSFSKSQNIGIGAVEGIKNSDVYNVVTNKLKEVSDELKNVVNNLLQQSGLPLDNINGLINENVRAVRDVFSTLQNTIGISPKDLEDAIAGFLPSGSPMEAQIQNMFRNLAAECRDGAASGLPGFKPFPDSLDCAGPSVGSSRCSQSQISGLLNKVTGGAVQSVGKSIQSTLRSLMTLANLGYSANMCKVFGALIKGMPTNVIQRSAAGLLALQGGSGNTTSVLDIASSIGGIVGINPSREISGLVTRITDNFTIPDNYKESQYGSLYEGMTTAFDIIDPGYDRSEDGLYSIAKLGTQTTTTEYKEVTKAWLSSDSSNASFDEPYEPEGYEIAVSCLASDNRQDYYPGSSGFDISDMW